MWESDSHRWAHKRNREIRCRWGSWFLFHNSSLPESSRSAQSPAQELPKESKSFKILEKRQFFHPTVNHFRQENSSDNTSIHYKAIRKIHQQTRILHNHPTGSGYYNSLEPRNPPSRAQITIVRIRSGSRRYFFARYSPPDKLRSPPAR